MSSLVVNYYDSAAMILFGVGFMTLLLNNNLIKKIIGMNIMDTSIFLFFITKGYISGRSAPIYGMAGNQASDFINPLPSALMLTGIVVAVSTTAFALALTIKIYETYGTIELDKVIEKRGLLNEHP
jgi:multicomponent Na+:H+ antiporter subunit C